MVFQDFRLLPHKTAFENIAFAMEASGRNDLEIESKVKADAEIALTARLHTEKEKIQKVADEQNELKFRHKEEQLKQLQEQLQIAQRKAEQGSM